MPDHPTTCSDAADRQTAVSRRREIDWRVLLAGPFDLLLRGVPRQRVIDPVW